MARSARAEGFEHGFQQRAKSAYRPAVGGTGRRCRTASVTDKMTKVQLLFKLAVPLDENSLRRLAGVTGIYGILRVTPDPEGQSLTVEYDATRFGPKDVEAAL